MAMVACKRGAIGRHMRKYLFYTAMATPYGTPVLRTQLGRDQTTRPRRGQGGDENRLSMQSLLATVGYKRDVSVGVKYLFYTANAPYGYYGTPANTTCAQSSNTAMAEMTITRCRQTFVINEEHHLFGR